MSSSLRDPYRSPEDARRGAGRFFPGPGPRARQRLIEIVASEWVYALFQARALTAERRIVLYAVVGVQVGEVEGVRVVIPVEHVRRVVRDEIAE